MRESESIEKEIELKYERRLFNSKPSSYVTYFSPLPNLEQYTHETARERRRVFTTM
jgi:hypothetical protein